MAHLAFLKPRNFFERLVALIDGGKHCHVELIFNDGTGLCTAYSSTRKTGVRKRKAKFNSKNWELKEVEADQQFCENWYQQHKDEGYDYLGAGRSRFSVIPQLKSRWFCVEVVATLLGLANPAKIGLRELHELIK